MDVSRGSQDFSRRSILKLGGVFAGAAAISVTLAACGGPSSTTGTSTSSSAGTGPKGDITAVIGYGNNQSWDPFMTASAFSMAANRHVYEGLVNVDLTNGQVTPALAKALPAEKGATSWTFELRDGVTFHDASPVTMDDVLFSFDRALKPTVEGTFVYVNAFFKAWIKGVSKVSDTKVKIDLNFPFDLGLARLELIKIVSKKAFDGKWADIGTGSAVLPLGTGPYAVKSNVPGTSTTFVANTAYNGPTPPNFTSMTWLSITDATARVNKIVSGEAVISDNVPAANIDTLKAAGKTVETGKGAGCAFLFFNTTAKPFDDPRVRQALMYAVDYDKLIKVALRGTGSVPTSYLPDFLKFASAKNAFTYDPAKAKKLLAEAGVPAGFAVNLLAVNVTWVLDCLPIVQEGWKAAGLDVTLTPMDTASLFKKMDQDAGYQVVLAAGNPQMFGTDPDLLIRNYYTKGAVWMKYTKWDGSADAAKVFDDLDAMGREPDAGKQRKRVQALLDVLSEQVVLYPLVRANTITGWDAKEITGVTAQPISGLLLTSAKTA